MTPDISHKLTSHGRIPVFGAIVCPAFVGLADPQGPSAGKMGPLYHPGDGRAPESADASDI